MHSLSPKDTVSLVVTYKNSYDNISFGMQLILANVNVDRYKVFIKVSKIISFRESCAVPYG